MLLPEITNRAFAGETFVISRRGQPLAVLIGISRFQYLEEIEKIQAETDWDILLTPPGPEEMSEEKARELAVRTVREVRAEKYRTRSK